MKLLNSKFLKFRAVNTKSLSQKVLKSNYCLNENSLNKSSQQPVHIWAEDKQKDINEFKVKSKMIVEDLILNWKNCNNRSVLPRKVPNFLKKDLGDSVITNEPQLFDNTIDEVIKKVAYNIVSCSSEGYISWFPCMPGYVAQFGQFIAYNLENPSKNWELNAVTFEIESIVTKWFWEAYNLPQNFNSDKSGSVIYHGVSLSSISSTLAARNKKLKQGFTKLSYYCSEQGHYSVRKGINIAGSKATLIPVKLCKKQNNIVIDVNYFEKKVQEDIANGYTPCYVMSTIGTTGTTAIDDTEEISLIARKYDIWHHVDAAYAANFSILPGYSKKILKGIDKVQSFAFNPVKLFPVLNNSAICYFENKYDMLSAYELDAIITKESNNLNNYEFGNARLNKSFKIYTAVKTIGFEYFQTLASRIVDCAKLVKEEINKNENFEVCFDSEFGLVTFKLKNKGDDELIKFMNQINSDGKIFIGPFEIKVDNKKYLVLRYSVNLLYPDKEKTLMIVRHILNLYKA